MTDGKLSMRGSPEVLVPLGGGRFRLAEQLTEVVFPLSSRATAQAAPHLPVSYRRLRARGRPVIFRLRAEAVRRRVCQRRTRGQLPDRSLTGGSSRGRSAQVRSGTTRTTQAGRVLQSNVRYGVVRTSPLRRGRWLDRKVQGESGGCLLRGLPLSRPHQRSSTTHTSWCLAGRRAGWRPGGWRVAYPAIQELRKSRSRRSLRRLAARPHQRSTCRHTYGYLIFQQCAAAWRHSIRRTRNTWHT